MINLFFLFVCTFSFICFLFSFNEVVKSKNIDYSHKIYQLINPYKNSKLYTSKKIKIENNNYKIDYIYNKSKNQNIIDETRLVNEILLSDAIKSINIEKQRHQNDLIIVSSNKYFNKLRFIFSNEEISYKEALKINQMFERGYFENKGNLKYIIKKDNVLNCFMSQISNKNFKYCAKDHHMRLKNYELHYQIFSKYNHFHFKIDNNYLKFNNEVS